MVAVVVLGVVVVIGGGKKFKSRGGREFGVSEKTSSIVCKRQAGRRTTDRGEQAAILLWTRMRAVGRVCPLITFSQEWAAKNIKIANFTCFRLETITGWE